MKLPQDLGNSWRLEIAKTAKWQLWHSSLGDIVDGTLHAISGAKDFGLWEAPICTIRRSGVLGKFIGTL
jgi:hypothetical protein